MRVGPRSKPNCWLDAPGYGRIGVVATTLGYGMSIASSESAARAKRTFYPFVRTSGAWYIEASFASAAERKQLHGWLLYYIARITDAYRTPLAPITVTVPSQEFMKVGYPSSSIEFGDAFGMTIYRSVVQFTSASDPMLSAQSGSQYRPPTRDADTARRFYPAGLQENTLPPPQSEVVFRDGDGVWGNPNDDPPLGGGGAPLRYR